MAEPFAIHNIDGHLARLTSDCIVRQIAACTRANLEKVRAILGTYAAECRHGLRLIEPQLPAGGKILEVGAGLGMLSSYLRMQGHDVTALEPCTSGFDFFSQIQAAVLEESGVDLPVLPIGAEELNPDEHGCFDFVFSVNVLEHIPNLTGAMRGMASVLTPGGRMWHTCPNYIFPYEPHYGLPLLPLFPRATALMLPRRITHDELWRSFNFITYFDLKRLARANALDISFQAGSMREALLRLESDQEFASRQRGIASKLYRIAKAVGFLPLIGTLPAWLSTPMIVAMQKSAATR